MCFKICVQGLNNQQIKFSDDILSYKFGEYRNDAFLSDLLVVSWERIINTLQVINFNQIKSGCLDTLATSLELVSLGVYRSIQSNTQS